MRQLISFEIDNALIKSIGEATEGTIIKLIDDSLIFITGDKIGLFSRATIDSINGDFSKVESTILHICQESAEFTLESGAYVH